MFVKLYGAKNCSSTDLLSWVLAAEYGISPLPEVARTEEGKPYFPSLPALCFNLSHTGPYILCAVSSKPVGVDIEQLRPRRDSLPRYAFTQEEYAQYEALGGDWPAFYTLWTRKEAWCKYTGEGLRRSWGTAPPVSGLCFGTYNGTDWRAAVCGEEAAPTEIIWKQEDSL